MATKRKTKFDDAVQKNIEMVTQFLIKIQSRHDDFYKQIFELQKQNIDMEKVLQMSLLRLLSMYEFNNAFSESEHKPVKNIPTESNAYK